MASSRFWLSLGLLFWGISSVDVCWPQEEDEEFRPGLVAEYRSGERRIERIDADVAFTWNDAAADSRLPAGPFETTWRGFVLIRLEAKHRLHAFVQGEVTVELDGKRVLQGSAKKPQWISGDEFVPGFGERPFVVTFRKTEPAAQLKLFWSSDVFGLEPLPPELLFHDPSRLGLRPDQSANQKDPDRTQGRDGVPTYALIELGRQQFEAFRCGRCHQRDGEEQPPSGPSLKHFAASGFLDDVVGRHLAMSPETGRVYPTFGFHDLEISAMELFLHQQSQPVELDKPKPVKEADLETERRKGEVLLRSTGCLACHRIGELGGTSPSLLAGPDLSNVGERRTLPWLVTWLAKPERLNADHRMPVFNLSDAERNQLALALWNLTSELDAKDSLRLTAEELAKNWKHINNFKSSKEDKAQAAYKAQTERGRKLAIELRCVACHRFSDNDAVRFERPASDLSQPVADWSKSCLAERADHAQLDRPIFGTNLNREAIKAYLASRRETKLSPLSPFARGQRVLEQKGCLVCHSRHGVGGFGKMAAQIAKFDKDLAGQAPSLVPPSLNAVGDKLLDEALSIAVRGERQLIRMPWLKVRMPKFKHSPDELALLTRYLVEHDRIPAMSEASGGRQPPARQDKIGDAQTHLAGQALTGVRGWSCIACHKIGDYEPKQVALGARGSDLKMLGKHIRPEFFFRWIASPLRVIPGVEMPQYNRPVVGVLDGDLAKQHAALWQALNDPNFQPPTNPNNVEQLWVVNPGERPRVIRDVFQLPKELGGGTVPRSFAVGFDNGHSFLFDLDNGSLRQWSFGDFARQQAVGKRWVWEMAGLPLRNFDAETEIQLWTTDDAPSKEVPLGPVREMDYLTKDAETEVVFNYTRWFDPNHRFLEIRETLRVIGPVSGASNPAGIERETLIWRHQLGGDDENELRVRIPKSLTASPAAKMELTQVSLYENYISDDGERTTIRPSDVERDGWMRIHLQTHAAVRLKSVYSANLQRPASSAVAKPVLKAERLKVASVPGFDGWQLPIDASIMPTALTWSNRGALAFTSLKGHAFVARDVDGDGLEDDLRLIQEGLAAPYGITSYRTPYSETPKVDDDVSEVDEFLVAHKPEVLHVVDMLPKNLEIRHVIAEGWGYNDDYHDWTCGFARDANGRFLFGLGSDYTDKNRPAAKSRWRGKVLRLDTETWLRKQEPPKEIERRPITVMSLTALGHAFRYPTGIAINDRDEVFVSDQQGVQNCFNEINYLVEGAHYGVPSTHEEDKDAPETKAAIQIPHPWTRSVNGLVFLTGKEGYPDLNGHGIGCEYNGRFLIRFTTQRVGDVMQGAVYPFSLTDADVVQASSLQLPATTSKELQAGSLHNGATNFLGPLCCGISPKGEIYIGSIADSGWAGGQNTGSIVKLKGNGQRPNGIREIRATRDGFDIDFFAPVDHARATNAENYSISGYTRVWGGAYATPDSDRHRCNVVSITLSDDKKTAKLKVDSRKTPNYVYDISCRDVAPADQAFFPSYGFFTLHKIPSEP